MTTRIDPVRYQRNLSRRSFLKNIVIFVALFAVLAIVYLLNARPVAKALLDLSKFGDEISQVERSKRMDFERYSKCVQEATDDSSRNACGASSQDAFILLMSALRLPDASELRRDLLLRARDAAIEENSRPYNHAVRRVHVACDEMFLPCPKSFGRGMKAATIPDYYLGLIDHQLELMSVQERAAQAVSHARVLTQNVEAKHD